WQPRSPGGCAAPRQSSRLPLSPPAWRPRGKPPGRLPRPSGRRLARRLHTAFRSHVAGTERKALGRRKVSPAYQGLGVAAGVTVGSPAGTLGAASPCLGAGAGGGCCVG